MDKIKDFVCQSCGEVFHSRSKLAWHREIHDTTPKACPFCGDKFMHRSSVTRHVRLKHDNTYQNQHRQQKEENVPCPTCKRVYLRSNLHTHLLTHKTPGFVCTICNKSFSTKGNLKQHAWAHKPSSARPYQCQLCTRAFFRESVYTDHINAHKKNRPYSCKHCGRRFIRKYNWKRHVREHETAKRYACPILRCGRTFHRKSYLTDHMKFHTGLTPYRCHICYKRTSTRSNHNRHMMRHLLMRMAYRRAREL